MKRIGMIALALCALLMLPACQYSKWRSDEAKDFTAAQIKSFEYQKPLVELVAKDGESIELKGVSAFRVYAPRDTTIRALPMQESGLLRFGEKLLTTAAQVAGVKFQSDMLTEIFNRATANAGDHSTTTFNYENSYNDNSDNSEHGPILTFSDSQVIAGNVEGPGAGIGNDSSEHTEVTVSGDGSAAGDGNEIVNGANNRNSGQIGEQNRRDTDDDTDIRTCTAGNGGAASGTDTGAGAGGACSGG